VLGAPELDAGLQVGSAQSRVEGQDPLPRPAGHASLDAAQDTVGLLGCERTLVAHVKLFIHHYPQVLLIRAALNPFIPQPVLIPAIAVTQMQDPALVLVEPHVPTSRACPRPSGWYPILLVCQLQHSAWCHLQTCKGCTQSR